MPYSRGDLHSFPSRRSSDLMFADFHIHVSVCMLAVSHGLRAKSSDKIPKHLESQGNHNFNIDLCH